MTVESINGELRKTLHEKGISVQNLTQINEKLHRDLDVVISSASRMEIQRVSYKEFLIKQVSLLFLRIVKNKTFDDPE